MTEGNEATTSKLFIKNYYWALKHLLKLKSKTDFLVREESIFQALRFLGEMQAPGTESPYQVKVSESSLLGARIMYALYRSKPLSHHDSANQDAEVLAESTATLTLHTCVSVVLASEITAFFPNTSAQVEMREALRLADEV